MTDISKSKSTKFDDNQGRTWNLVLTAGLYMKLQTEYGVNIDKVFDDKDNWLTELLQRNDMILFLQILHTMCKKDQEAKGLSDEEFFDGLTGDILGEATEALVESVINFLPAHRQIALRGLMSSMQEGLEEASRKVVEMQPQLRSYLTEEIDSELEVLVSNLRKKRQS